MNWTLHYCHTMWVRRSLWNELDPVVDLAPASIFRKYFTMDTFACRWIFRNLDRGSSFNVSQHSQTVYVLSSASGLFLSFSTHRSVSSSSRHGILHLYLPTTSIWVNSSWDIWSCSLVWQLWSLRWPIIRDNIAIDNGRTLHQRDSL